MSVLTDSQNLFEAERQVFLERPSNVNEVGDIVGSAKATWVRLNDDGLGVVKYRNKRYKTIPLGARSIPRGTTVELSFAKGVYFSSW